MGVAAAAFLVSAGVCPASLAADSRGQYIFFVGRRRRVSVFRAYTMYRSDTCVLALTSHELQGGGGGMQGGGGGGSYVSPAHKGILGARAAHHGHGFIRVKLLTPREIGAHADTSRISALKALEVEMGSDTRVEIAAPRLTDGERRRKKNLARYKFPVWPAKEDKDQQGSSNAGDDGSMGRRRRVSRSTRSSDEWSGTPSSPDSATVAQRWLEAEGSVASSDLQDDQLQVEPKADVRARMASVAGSNRSGGLESATPPPLMQARTVNTDAAPPGLRTKNHQHKEPAAAGGGRRRREPSTTTTTTTVMKPHNHGKQTGSFFLQYPSIFGSFAGALPRGK